MITKSKQCKVFFFCRGQATWFWDFSRLTITRLPLLNRHAFLLGGQLMCIYGDPAYPMRAHLIQPFRDRVLTPQMQAFNTSMSKVREAVEWLHDGLRLQKKFWPGGPLISYITCHRLPETINEVFFSLSILFHLLDLLRLLRLSRVNFCRFTV